MADKKIKEIYGCDNNKTRGDTLVDWYNEIIEKTEAELTIFDVFRCFRQNIFIESAVVVLLSYLQNNVFAGDMYEGEGIENLSGLDDKYLLPYITTVDEILIKARKDSTDHEGLCQEDKEDFDGYIKQLSDKISRMKK